MYVRFTQSARVSFPVTVSFLPCFNAAAAREALTAAEAPARARYGPRGAAYASALSRPSRLPDAPAEAGRFRGAGAAVRADDVGRVDDERASQGLFLVECLATRWGWEPRHPIGKTVWAEVAAGRPQEASVRTREASVD
ncbi:hypothetical protein SMICM304S_09124 [Streptomyces microflavus]